METIITRSIQTYMDDGINQKEALTVEVHIDDSTTDPIVRIASVDGYLLGSDIVDLGKLIERNTD